MERNRSLEIKVGLFVALGLAGFVAMIIVLGSDDALFEKRYGLNAKFGNVSGLRTGAGVFVAGMDCGIVDKVEFASTLKEQKVFVHLAVRGSCRERIRGDSVASIGSQGLLGDKIVTVSIGSDDRAVMAEGSWLASSEPTELSDFMGDGRVILTRVRSITEKLDVALGEGMAPEAGKSVGEILTSLRNIIAEVEKGEGLIHALVYEPEISKRLVSTLRSAEQAAVDLRVLMDEVKTGDGLVHNLVYEDEFSERLKKGIDSLQGTAERVDAVIEEIQTGDGLLHDLIYTDEGQSMLADLKDVSADLREMTAATRRGEGTLGGLIVDPTIYRDVKTLLGKAQRNKILRSYVRNTLRRAEQDEGVSEAGRTK